MQAVEFDADVKDYSIKIPRKFRELEARHIKIIALYKEDHENKRRKRSFIDKIMKSPIRVKNFRPMKREDIYER